LESGSIGRIVVSRDEVFHCIGGTEIMVTWVRRGLGGIAKKNTTMSHRLLSSITARPALLA
jgi:hypothetical protein